MKESIENSIREAFKSWEEGEVKLEFNKRVVWEKIQPKKGAVQKNRFYPIAAAVFLLLSGGLVYLFFSNQELSRNYQRALLELQQQREFAGKAVEKKKMVEYKTEAKCVVKDSPKLKKRVEYLEKELIALQSERKNLNRQLVGAVSEVRILRDSVSFLKERGLFPTLAERKIVTELESKERQNELKITIDKEALSQLPLNEKKRQHDKLQIKVIDTDGGVKQAFAPLFSSSILD